MKKIFFIIYCIFQGCTAVYGQWSGKAANQWVTTSDLIGNFTYIGNYKPNNKYWFRKDSVRKWIAIDQTNPYYNSKQENEIIAKRDLTPAIINGCSSEIRFLQNDSYGNQVFFNPGTLSGIVTLNFDTVQPSFGTSSEIYVSYYGDTLSKWTAWNYRDTVINFDYNYDANKGNTLVVGYKNGGFHFDACYNISVGCPAPSATLAFQYDEANKAIKIVRTSGNINSSFTISSITLDGYPDGACSSQTETAQSQAYTYSSSTPATEDLFMLSQFINATYYHYDNGVTINGTTYHDGDLANINGQYIQIYISDETGCTQL